MEKQQLADMIRRMEADGVPEDKIRAVVQRANVQTHSAPAVAPEDQPTPIESDAPAAGPDEQAARDASPIGAVVGDAVVGAAKTVGRVGSHVGRAIKSGFGLGELSPEDKQAFDEADTATKAHGVAEHVGGAVPYLATMGGGTAATLAGRVGAGAAENAVLGGADSGTAKGAVVGAALGGALPAVAAGASKAAGALAPKLLRQLGITDPKVAQAVLDEGVTGNSLEELHQALRARKGAVGEAVGGHVAKLQQGYSVPGSAVRDAYAGRIAELSKGGAPEHAMARRLQRDLEALAIPDQLDPQAAMALKVRLGRQLPWDSNGINTGLNEARRRAVLAIGDVLKRDAPELHGLSERYSNLTGAEEGVQELLDKIARGVKGGADVPGGGMLAKAVGSATHGNPRGAIGDTVQGAIRSTAVRSRVAKILNKMGGGKTLEAPVAPRVAGREPGAGSVEPPPNAPPEIDVEGGGSPLDLHEGGPAGGEFNPPQGPRAVSSAQDIKAAIEKSQASARANTIAARTSGSGMKPEFFDRPAPMAAHVRTPVKPPGGGASGSGSAPPPTAPSSSMPPSTGGAAKASEFTEQVSPKTGTFGLKGAKGEKVGGRVLDNHIEMTSIGKGEATSSQSAVEALRAFARRQGKPVYFTSTNLSVTGGQFRTRMMARGELIQTPEGLLLKGTGPKGE